MKKLTTIFFMVGHEEILRLSLCIMKYLILFHKLTALLTNLHREIFKNLCVSKILFKIQDPIYEILFVWYAAKAWNIIKFKNVKTVD